MVAERAGPRWARRRVVAGRAAVRAQLFTRELVAALQHIRDFPEVPAVWGRVRDQPVRRVLLSKTRQHVYYLVNRQEGVVRIHAIRGTRRLPPPL